MRMKYFIVSFLLLACFSQCSQVEANCNYKECEAKTKNFCLCPSDYNYPNHSNHWPVPIKDQCRSIGCMLDGSNCQCRRSHDRDDHGDDRRDRLSHVHSHENCECNANKCNKTLCTGKKFENGCFCYFGNKVIRTYGMPISKNCSDLLSEIGDHNGHYQCSAFSCNCDQYGDCVCKPPKNMIPQSPKPKQCDSKQCEKQSFDFCECSYTGCP